MSVQIEESWKAHLNGEFEKPYFSQLTEAVRQEYMQTTCYPPGKLIFNAFNLCPFDKVKVVIIGQDPYHEPGQAHGLSFSVQDGIQFPPSLQNIFSLSCKSFIPNRSLEEIGSSCIIFNLLISQTQVSYRDSPHNPCPTLHHRFHHPQNHSCDHLQKLYL